MEIEVFTLCDHAQDIGGKFVIVGTFDVIYGTTFPVQQPFAVAMRLRFSITELGQHKVILRMIDVKGTELAKVEGDLNISPPQIGEHSSINLPININGKFDSPGKYSFELSVDGEFRSGLSFYLVKR